MSDGQKNWFGLKNCIKKDQLRSSTNYFFTDLTFPDQPLKICPSQKKRYYEFWKKNVTIFINFF